MKQANIAFMILTFNEELHIRRCIESCKRIKEAKIIVLDSFSKDNTIEICRELGVKTVCHKFVTHSNQVNWALDNLFQDFDWVIRIDADEILDDDLVNFIPRLARDCEVGAYKIRRRIQFLGKILNYGGMNKIYVTRIFRPLFVRSTEVRMDEHIVTNRITKKVKASIIDKNEKGLRFWLEKHFWYSHLQAEDLNSNSQTDGQPLSKQIFHKYSPKLFRCWILFFVKYILQFGFLDGKPGYVYWMMVCFYYRTLVDIRLTRGSKDF